MEQLPTDQAEQPENAQDSILVKAQITIAEPVKVQVTITEPDEIQDATIEPDNKDTIIELYKLEYTTGVKRHDDIYKSMWTNFSYMAILAGGILTFGKGLLPTEFISALACIPLIFWFWSSYLPLDRYGNQVSLTMAELEKFINTTYFSLNQTQQSEENSDQNQENRQSGIFLYTDFESRKNKNVHTDNNTRLKIRVFHSVMVFTILLHILFIGLLGRGIYNCTKNDCLNTPSETTEKKLESINNTLGNMSNSINGLKDTNAINPQNKDTGNNNVANSNQEVKAGNSETPK